jgi:glutaryl-CoA transferase
LVPLLRDRLLERSAEEWVEALHAAGVPVGKVRNVPEALRAAAAAGRPATMSVQHPTAGALELVASPIWTTSAPAAGRPPPLLGEHTEAILHELGRSDEEIAALLADGVVAQAGTSSNDDAPI